MKANEVIKIDVNELCSFYCRFVKSIPFRRLCMANSHQNGIFGEQPDKHD
jgi:hypothetical protein